MHNIADFIPRAKLTNSKGLQAKMFPNGDCVLWKPKRFKPAQLVKEPDAIAIEHRMARFRLHLTERSLEGAIAAALGLSPHPNFDILIKKWADARLKSPKVLLRKGLKGITSHGKRVVRNAAYLLEVEGGKARCTFATVTVPSLPMKQMAVIHKNWHKVVERYRLGIRRALQKQGLAGELVSVTEFQEKRYERTGVPVAHIHSVFIGKNRLGKWAISTELHDAIWFNALRTVVRIKWRKVAAAANMQRVRKSAAAYLAKYISKGVGCVTRIIEDGYSDWLPKQWFSCSRTLSRRIDEQTRRIDDLADWLAAMTNVEGKDIWVWHREVLVEVGDSTMQSMAIYGRLSTRQTAQIKKFFCTPNGPPSAPVIDLAKSPEAGVVG